MPARLLAVMLLCLAAAVPDAAAQALRWPALTPEARPWTRWWWHGSAVEPAELTRELETFAAAGLGGVEVTAIYGVRGREDDFIPYLSGPWVDALRHAAREAHRLGVGLDMPPGSGWRAGGPYVPLEDANTALDLVVDTVAGGDVWDLPLEGRHLHAAAAYAADGRRVDLVGEARGDALRWTAPAGTWTVYAAATRWSGEHVKRPAPGGRGYSIDPFSASAVTHYLEAYAERIDALPDGTVRAFFHDSFEYGGDASDELFAAFERLRGYDLADHLPALAGHGDRDAVARVKADVRETLSDMLLDHFARPFAAWAHRQGSLARNQAHGSPANLLDVYAAADIPETEIFGPFGGPDNDPLISRFAASAAHVAGRRLASAETATWLGEHFTVTLGDLKRAVDQLFASGINHVVYHGTAYSPADADWPGWLFYASTPVNPRNALWRDLPALNRYVARTQAVLQSGAPDDDVLLYWPVHDSWHDPEGLRMDFRVHDPDWFYGRPIGGAAQALRRAGYAFDYASDRQLQAARAVDGRLDTGSAAYRVAVVPRTDHMPVATFERLVALAGAGAAVAFQDRLPADVPGLYRLEARRRRLEALKDRLAFGTPDADGVRTARVGRGRVLVGPSVDALAAAADALREPMVGHRGIEYVRRRHEGGHHYFVRHDGRLPVDGWVPLAVDAVAVAVMDPMTGRAGLAHRRTGVDGRTEVYLQLAPGASVILRTFDRAVEGAAWAYRVPGGPPVTLEGEWRVDFVEGGPVRPQGFETDTLASWTALGGAEAQRFAGTARYRLRFDAPAGAAGSYLLDLGDVAESARVRLNGRDLGTLVAPPFHVETGPIEPQGNVLEVEVTSLSANRIRDLDRRGVPWQIFHDINFVGIDYGPFDASGWPVRPSGLLGPVRLVPLARP